MLSFLWIKPLQPFSPGRSPICSSLCCSETSSQLSTMNHNSHSTTKTWVCNKTPSTKQFKTLHILSDVYLLAGQSIPTITPISCCNALALTAQWCPSFLYFLGWMKLQIPSWYFPCCKYKVGWKIQNPYINLTVLFWCHLCQCLLYCSGPES